MDEFLTAGQRRALEKVIAKARAEAELIVNRRLTVRLTLTGAEMRFAGA
jgi:hypothetical protein